MKTTWRGASLEIDLLTVQPDVLVAAVSQLKTSFPHETWNQVSGVFDVPTAELETSPISSRITWLAAQRGALFAHHEVKSSLPLPEHLGPEQGTSSQTGWVGGALVEPRHFSFGQDHRIQTFHPNHREQWRPHELAHSLSGFFWHPNLTRFELYLSARLNELLPIIHWYGWDRLARPACEKHAMTETYRAYCPVCGELTKRPWFDSTYLDVPERDMFWARQGLDHFRREWGALVEEFETGGRIKTPRGPLDASSDAVGYLTGHWNRTTSWGFGRWVETCMKPGRDYENDFEGWLQKHLQMHTGLFTDDLQFDQTAHQEERLRRVIQEMTYRSTMSLEHLPETSKAADAAESILEPWLDQVHQTLVGDTCELTSLEALAETWFGLLPTLQTYLPDHVAQALGGLGLRRLNKSLNVIQLQEGLHAIDVDVALEDVEKFANSTDFASQGFLIERWARLKPSPQTNDAAFFQQACGRDEDGELFGALPDLEEEIPLAELRLNTTATWRQIESDEEWDCAFSWHGEVRLIRCSTIERDWLLQPREMNIPEELATWLEMGLLLWLPTPRGRNHLEG